MKRPGLRWLMKFYWHPVTPILILIALLAVAWKLNHFFGWVK